MTIQHCFSWQSKMPYMCVLKCDKPCKSSDIISQGKWKSLQAKVKLWTGLDQFGDIYDTISRENGLGAFTCTRHVTYPFCCQTSWIEPGSTKKKHSELAQSISQTSSSETEVGNSQCDDETDGQLPPKRLRSSIGGPPHGKTKCVWCMQGVDKKHPDRTRGKMFKLNTQCAWRAFKRHTVLIEGRELRVPLSRLVESTSAISDPFANDIMYHHSCWRKYISQTQFEPDDAIHLQDVCLSEARNLFFLGMWMR